MNTTELSSSNGEFYRSEGASGFSTFIVPVVSVVCLLCFCTIFPSLNNHGWSALAEDGLLVLSLWFGIAIFTLGVTYAITKLQHSDSYIQLDDKGITGRANLTSGESAEFAYNWEEITSVNFHRTRIIIANKIDTFTYEYPFICKSNTDLLLALNKFGGDRILNQVQLKKLLNHRYRILIIVGIIALIYAIGISITHRSEPYYYHIYDAAIADGNTYAVGTMSQKIGIDTHLPVMWKNNEIVILGPVGHNYADHVAVMRGVPYISCKIDDEMVIIKNGEIIHTFPSDRYLSIRAMAAYKDSLFVMGRYGASADSVIEIWKYVNGEDFISISNDEISDVVWENLQSDKVINKAEKLWNNKKKSYPRHNYFSIKMINNDWYELVSGQANVRCEDGEIMDAPLIIKYNKKDHPNDWTTN